MPPERTWVITGRAAPRRGRPSSCRAARRPHRRRAVRPRHRRLHRPGRGPRSPARTRDAVMLVTPADHVIEPVQEFRRAVHAAAQIAEEHPGRAHHLRHPADVPGHRLRLHPPRRRGRRTRQGVSVFRVQAFREKPTADLAEQFVASGEYFWNSGIFVWKAATILERTAAAASRSCTPPCSASPTPGTRRGGTRCCRSEYETMEKISIDYAVMEHAPGRCWWCRRRTAGTTSGSWLALERHEPAGRRRQHGPGDARRHQHARTASSSATPGQLIATIGVERPAHRPGRRRHPGRRPPRGGRRSSSWSICSRSKGWRNTCEALADGVLLGVDYGTVRVGLAVSDPDRMIASPLETYTRRCRSRRMPSLRADRRGSPCRAGRRPAASRRWTRGHKSREARAFGAGWRVCSNFRSSSGTSSLRPALAEDALLAANLNHRKRRDRRDRVAAQMILQNYIDAGSPPEGTSPLHPVDGPIIE